MDEAAIEGLPPEDVKLLLSLHKEELDAIEALQGATLAVREGRKRLAEAKSKKLRFFDELATARYPLFARPTVGVDMATGEDRTVEALAPPPGPQSTAEDVLEREIIADADKAFARRPKRPRGEGKPSPAVDAALSPIAPKRPRRTKKA